MRVLAVNSGSSSVKCALFEGIVQPGSPKSISLTTLFTGAVTGIGSRASLKYREDRTAWQEQEASVKNHDEAARLLLHLISGKEVDAIGHRVVHGGHWFTETVRIDEGFLSRFDQLAELAPLHNPASLAGIREARAFMGDRVPMVAVFDTAFHSHLPDYARTYALPHDLTERYHLRRYGFHGLAHGSSAALYADHAGKPAGMVDLITLHLGNGCSATAIRGGQSIDTSMGFTPLEGLIMGTRCGDIDPALVAFLARVTDRSCEDIERMLNEQSGLLGLSGLSPDMAVLLQAERDGHQGARLAVESFCYRARKYLGAYLAALGPVEAIVFSGGIGEHAPGIRSRICSGMEWLGLVLDPEANEAVTKLQSGAITRITRTGSMPAAFVAGVDEQSAIARETVLCLTDVGRR
jgi:acetate kinase